MTINKELLGSGEEFSEVLETRIEAGEGMFEEPHPFLRTALRGLAERLNHRVIPMGFVLATELYIHDMNTGTNGFTGEPMPSEVTGMPPMMSVAVNMVARNIAQEAFGEEFHSAVVAFHDEEKTQS
jgi:hypothetical protein